MAPGAPLPVQISNVRIATWNLEGKWPLRHHRLAESLDADMLLLTEVLARVEISGMPIHRTQGEMQSARCWVAVAAQSPVVPLPDPHGATALAQIDGMRVVSSVLPWRNSGSSHPWARPDQGPRTEEAIAAVEAANPVIWDGDWNHELTGRLYAGLRRRSRPHPRCRPRRGPGIRRGL
jgi:hypothetical protein